MAPDPMELYKWDLQGVLHLKAVLPPDTVKRALEAVEVRPQPPPILLGLWVWGESNSWTRVWCGHQAAQRGEVEGDMIGWEDGHDAPFKAMMSHPAVRLQTAAAFLFCRSTRREV